MFIYVYIRIVKHRHLTEVDNIYTYTKMHFVVFCRFWLITLHFVASPVATEDYHHRIISRSGRPGWQGGKHLALSALFPHAFCRALLNCWLETIIAARRAEIEQSG